MQLPSDGAAAALAPQAAHAGALLGQGPQPLAAGVPGMLHGERCALPVMMSLMRESADVLTASLVNPSYAGCDIGEPNGEGTLVSMLVRRAALSSVSSACACAGFQTRRIIRACLCQPPSSSWVGPGSLPGCRLRTPEQAAWRVCILKAG